ncbi:MAG: sugar nucleotide-binding protein [Chloroflexota bacterium]|nr:sugar nucleotide-binding protein [Chloroflexota bacterium]
MTISAIPGADPFPMGAAIHAAAMENVDLAEPDRAAARQVNADATHNVVDACRVDGYRFSGENL